MKASKIIQLIFSLLCLTAHGQDENGCRNAFSDGKFAYKESQFDAKIKIKGNYHFEDLGPKYGVLKSKIEWLEDCKLKLTIVKCKKRSGFQIGQSIELHITNIQGSEITYISVFNGKTQSHTLVRKK